MSEHFSAAWLALREAADHRARPGHLVRVLDDVLPAAGEIRILDLASGTGSNVRYLSRHLRRGAHAGPAGRLEQRWLLADHDESLLKHAKASVPLDVTTRIVDLSNSAEAGLLFDGQNLVTASALLDLVSEGWLRAALLRCHASRAHVLFALNYDGRIECSPADVDDTRVRDLVNRHQRTDKGFGPALGPDAAQTTARLLTGLGYRVERASSEWVIDANESELQGLLIEGWADAASTMAPDDAGRIAAWRVRRQQQVSRGKLRLVVGHEDVVGLAPAT